MTKLRSIIAIFLVLMIISVFSDAYAHSMFNSAESFLGGYRVQVATLPEFPEIGEASQILFRITDGDFEEVESFTMGIRFFYNDQQIDAIVPEFHTGSHFEIDYVWENSGNHIVKVDLYGMNEKSEILTYTFNLGTQNPFGKIFFLSITFGALVLTAVVGYVYLPKMLSRTKT